MLGKNIDFKICVLNSSKLDCKCFAYVCPFSTAVELWFISERGMLTLPKNIPGNLGQSLGKIQSREGKEHSKV